MIAMLIVTRQLKPFYKHTLVYTACMHVPLSDSTKGRFNVRCREVSLNLTRYTKVTSLALFLEHYLLACNCPVRASETDEEKWTYLRKTRKMCI